ncbi:FtsX-like permease family protein, partial [uncultured Demequina sp.]|uniref:FtsX-like permease family protein n=1 Tax=uncultured Demequina sp. TaxID=693499 RepID=UPI0025D76DED
LVEGRLPADPTGRSRQVSGPNAGIGVVASLGDNGESVYVEPEVIEIALTRPVASPLEFDLDDVIMLEDVTGARIALRITGIVEPEDPQAEVWSRFPDAVSPAVVDNPSRPLFRRGTVLVQAATLDELASRLGTAFPGTIELSVSPETLTLDSARTLASSMRDLTGSSDLIGPEADVTVQVASGLGPALDAYPARARAALAQMSVVVAGVIAVGAVVIALMSRLLVSRRERDIALERARGASVASVALRMVIESALVTGVGLASGYAAARAAVGPVAAGNLQALLVAGVAVIAAPVLAVAMARGSWTGRREPANRQDRARKRRARAARRLTLEALAVVLGVLAVVTLRGRGVLQTQTEGIDPFLAAAPVLVALAIVVIVVRLYPLPMAVIQALARRTRGVSGAITLAKAREPIPVLPLLALTLAIAVAVSSGLLVGTVREGQEQAAWERVGGQVRIDAPVDDATVDDLASQGLETSIVYTRVFTNLTLGSETLESSLVAFDEAYPDIVDQAGIVDAAELRELHALEAQRADGDPVPVLASPELAALEIPGDRSQIYIGREHIPVEIVGIATATPDGWMDGPFVMAPLEGLETFEYDTPWTPNLAFVGGDGAEEAVTSTPSIPADAVTTREGWLEAVRGSALIGGVEALMALAVATVGALAAVALLITVMQGVRERGRALAMLRTQGMGAAYGWWLALAELGPLTAAAVVGGAGAGLAILALLGGALGLEVLAGGLAAPALVASPLFIAAVAGGVVALLLLAVTTEVIAHRRERLSDVLRYGESR